MRQPFTEMRLPHTFFRGLGGEEYDALPLMQHQPLDEHESNKGFSETYAIAQKRTAVLSCDLHQGPIRLLLITIDVREHLGTSLVPLSCCQLVTAEEFSKRL